MYHFCNKLSLTSALVIAGFGISTPILAQTTSVEVSEAQVVLSPVVLTPQQMLANNIENNFVLGGDVLADFAAFYASRDNQPIWADGNPSTMLSLITALEQAPTHGLPLARYNIAELEALWMAGNGPEERAALEVAAAQSYVRFATDMLSGMLDPKSIHKEMNAESRKPEVGELLGNVAGALNQVAFYKALKPFSAEYDVLLLEKAALERQVSSDANGGLVPTGRTLRPGHSNDRVVALRARLNSMGYKSDDLASDVYSDDIIAAVKLFQEDAGLNADGLAGPKTLAAINAGPEQHLKQVIVNLERLRWMNYELGARHIYVNIPDYTASVVDNGASTLSFRVVVGTGRNQTAEFSDTMTHMITNPSWNVPTSISSKEYLPKLLRDPTVLQRSNIEMRVRGSGQIVDSTMIDYSAYSTGYFPFVLRQRPGGGNALGRVKFMFPNKFNIYLHDTPSRSLFARDARAYSHGCVRVENPFDLAYELLSVQETDPQTAFDTILSTRRETRIDLETAIPVHIVYRTAWADSEGVMQYRADVYGRDRMVMDALLKAGVTLVGLEG